MPFCNSALPPKFTEVLVPSLLGMIPTFFVRVMPAVIRALSLPPAIESEVSTTSPVWKKSFEQLLRIYPTLFKLHFD